ncbi:16S rRNA (guanine(966)-N(2))-methyltransferase RsmD [Sulfurimonas sp. MAG313]|nr:16S rRNA (guanine(966)-N(2))-methyltransferase RsmD [Sulfurimonas sp. MAG313]MDF1880101.1 16S rRNA (guanine(966)-N(2))-methyltransferase RsmD [Sulfurimonas sp. MAG313]
MSKLQTSVVAGKYKGKKLDLPSLDTTRSSKVIVKESYFNTLQFDVMDCTLVEVFSGSGSIGIEALSRGAKHVYFMEKDKAAFKTLSKNIHGVGASNCTALYGDSFENIEQVKKELSTNKTKAFFYVDPPFSFREGMEEIYNKMFSMLDSIPLELIEKITIEHMTGLELPENIGSLSRKKSKKFGKTSLTHYVNPLN